METPEIPLRNLLRQKISPKQRNTYLSSQTKYVLTTRFNTATWDENKAFREKERYINCIYCSPNGTSQSIPLNSLLFVLEMNNTTNQIMGIGLVRNTAFREHYKVYKYGYYNLVAYIGYHRIEREDLCFEKIGKVCIWEELEQICFKGKGHLKMGNGMTSFPVNALYHFQQQGIDVIRWISKKFKEKYKCNTIDDGNV